MASTLDLYSNEDDFFLVLLCSYLTSIITTTCCLNTCLSQVLTLQSLSVVLPQLSDLNSDMFFESLNDWQSPPDSNCWRKFTNKPSGRTSFNEDVTLDEHGNADITQGWRGRDFYHSDQRLFHSKWLWREAILFFKHSWGILSHLNN